MATITKITAREILDSRGNPTVEADLSLSDGGFGRAAVPSGASTGIHEALELRDGGKRYDGKGVQQAVDHIRTTIREEVLRKEYDQRDLDEELIKLDGTPEKKRLGANALLAVSLSFAKAQAASSKIPLWKYFNEVSGGSKPELPTPTMNILNGGKHASGSVDLQEFMIVPSARSFAERLRIGAEVYHALRSLLSEQKLSTLVGDEGGFAPHLTSNEEPLTLLVSAIERAGYKPGKDVSLATDAAASSFFTNGSYRLAAENRTASTDDLISMYGGWAKRFPLVFIEDGLAEDEWGGWQKLNAALGKKLMLVGDDLFVTNRTRLERGIQEKSANSILIKLNQIGTVTETIDVVETAHAAGFSCIVSHRSGETEDTTIAHLAVGLGTGWIKTGAPARGERTAKYNELLRIEESLEQNKN